ncbi:hypothetical protein FOZ60_010080 [Perkinsus olseni]|uniref:Uncharacterized protein n=1 Tax=Perkinsus olseni TaxID=32597 RepID=A0A7J6NH50_PEROL|nr:hypothetical protein FOZ60_010080 [Perkinsus olseni]
MNPSTIVQTLVAAALMMTIAGAVPENWIFTSTVSGICFMVGWPPKDPGPIVSYYAGCPHGGATALDLKVIESPRNTFTFNLTDEQTATEYNSFIEETRKTLRTSCPTVLKIMDGDMEKIIYEPTPGNQTLEISIGSIQRTFALGNCAY